MRDNRRVLTETAYRVANFRQSTSQQPDTFTLPVETRPGHVPSARNSPQGRASISSAPSFCTGIRSAFCTPSRRVHVLAT